MGFEKIWFNKDSLILNATKVFLVKKKPLVLNEIQIIEYLVPYTGGKKNTKINDR
jgi:hypothetical protein